MKKITLNQLQILHQNTQCAGKKCSLPGCVNCLCGKRIDAAYCSNEHKALHNNYLMAKEDFQYLQRKKINKKNTDIIVDLYQRGYRKLDYPALKLAGFDFSVSPLGGMVNGRKVALYGQIALWPDSDRMLNLVKI
ncbi:MAG: hypothetical protein K0R26_1959 [Bacteroidota bacterium]|jgi:hypothetical protein|nr:hypothetical protein [Bacteroidota bacterium]